MIDYDKNNPEDSVVEETIFTEEELVEAGIDGDGVFESAYTKIIEEDRQLRTKNKKFLKVAIAIIAIVTVLILLGSVLKPEDKVIDKTASPDGRFTIELIQCGELFPTDTYKGKIVMKLDGKVLNDFGFSGSKGEKELTADKWTYRDAILFMEVKVYMESGDYIYAHLYYDGEFYVDRRPADFNEQMEEIAEDREEAKEEQSDSAGTSENADESTDDWMKYIEAGYEAIYNQLNQGNNYTFIWDYDAKGYSSIILLEDDEKVEYLTYDHNTSSKEICKYVYYRSYKDEEGQKDLFNTEILGYYSYDIEKGSLID